MLGAWIRRARQARGWSQRELGERADVTTTAISQLERGGPVTLSRASLQRIARAFGLSLAEMRHAAEGDAAAEAAAAAVPARLAADLVAFWPRMSREDQEAVRALHRVLRGRYGAAQPPAPVRE